MQKIKIYFLVPEWSFKGADSRKNIRKIYKITWDFKMRIVFHAFYAIKMHFLDGRGVAVTS